MLFFFFQAEDGIRDLTVTGVQTCALPISDCCQIWDNWVGEFEGMGALEDLTTKAKDWKHYKDVLPLAWQTVTVKNKIASLPWLVTNDALYYRTDRLNAYSSAPAKADCGFGQFLA